MTQEGVVLSLPFRDVELLDATRRTIERSAAEREDAADLGVAYEC
jgi:hypothetical protein